MRAIFAPSLLVLLTGCATAPDIAPTVPCGAWDFGIARSGKEVSPPYPQAMARQDNCLRTTYAAGFEATDPPPDPRMTVNFTPRADFKGKPVVRPPVRAPHAVADTASLPAAVPLSLRGAHASATLQASPGWRQVHAPSPMYQLYAIHEGRGAATFVSVFDANPFMIWSDVLQSTNDKLVWDMQYSDSTPVREFAVGGHAAYQIEYRGRDRHGAPLHFLSTLIRSSDRLVYVTSWSFEQDYEANRAEFARLAETVMVERR